ncbi:MAG: PH domain-containing protein [Candidatus Woesearchaeota archaeon]
MEPLTLKPNRTVLVTFQRIIGITISLLFAIALITIGLVLEGAQWVSLITIGVGTLLLLNVPWIIYSTKIRYEKTNYRFEKTRIVTTTGGPFSDSSTELEIRNVTHVKLVLPWIENKLFGTGAVHVESAGTAGVEAHLLYLDEPERIYTIVQDLMKRNGFSLSSEKNLMETRASPTGAIIDVISASIGTLFVLLYFGGASIIPLLMISPVLLIIPAIVLIISAIGLYAYYLNSVSKTYTITEDGVYYDEGFLTKRRAVIPVENLSNSQIREPLLKRIFGVSDVIVSCQGSGSQIKFCNLTDAKRFDTSISTLIDTDRTPVASEEKPDHRGEVRAAARKRAERRTRAATVKTTNYKPSMRPAFVSFGISAGLAFVLLVFASVIAAALGALSAFPLLIGIVVLTLIVGAVGLIGNAIMIAVTTYTIEPNRVKSNVDFFNRDEQSFSDDRITRITLRRSIIDRIAKTVSVDYWSIGSGARITFRSVDEASGIIRMLEEKYGLREPTEHLIRSEPRIGTILKAYTYSLITSAFVLAIAAVVNLFVPYVLTVTTGIVVLIFFAIILSERLTYRNAYFTIDENTLYETHGWFTRTQSFVNVEDIKGVTTTQYPFGTEGSIAFNVAGEGIIKTDKGEHVIPNTVNAPYIPSAFDTSHELSVKLDEFAPPSDAQRTVHLSSSRIAVPIMLIGIILPLLPIVLIAAVIAAIRASRTTFLIEEHRIVREVRFIYPTRKVIFYDRIDHLNTSQRFFDKIFKTGIVQVTTTGSSKIEMDVGPTRDHLTVHEALDKAYR